VKLLIKNGRVIDPSAGIDETLDILIDRKKIVDMKPRLNANDAHIIDASRLVVAPGFIDMHVHLRDPGQEDKETIKTGSKAAARGGFTSIACMPNTSPVNDNRGITEYIITEAKRNADVNVFPIASITRGSEGKELTDMADLVDAGVVAFSDDGRSIQNNLVMRRALEYSRQLDALIIDHCEDRSLADDGVMHEGYHSYSLGLKGIPSCAEEIMVARDVILAEKTGARIHLAHLSTSGSVALLRLARNKKIQVSAEATPHHLLLTDAAVESYDTNLKVNPPLRSRPDTESLIKAVKDGLIDVFATDHAPHTADEKAVEFDQAPFGINGLETAVSLILDRLVQKNIIPIQRCVEMFSTNPARLLKLKDKGQIRVGGDADLTILNLHKDVVVDKNTFESKSRNTPFQGWKLRGLPVMTIVGGKIVHST